MRKIRQDARAATKKTLGGKLSYIATGSAPTSKEVLQWMKRCVLIFRIPHLTLIHKML